MPLPGLGIDPSDKIHLAEAAGWTRFQALAGLIFCFALIIIGIFADSFLSFSSTTLHGNYGSGKALGIGVGISIVYFIFALIYFFPCLFLFRFSANMKKAFAFDDQKTLTISFHNLKKLFRYIGILTIIILAFAAIVILTWVV